jgi:hypothetical protein
LSRHPPGCETGFCAERAAISATVDFARSFRRCLAPRVIRDWIAQ